MSRAVWVAIAAAAMLALAGWGSSAGAAILDEDYDPFDAVVTDTQGIVTECYDFGYATGPNILLAHRGDADVDVPLRRVRLLEIGAIVERTRRAPCKATLTSGKVVQLELDNSELFRLLYGESELGQFRIRLEKVRRLEILPPAQDAP